MWDYQVDGYRQENCTFSDGDIIKLCTYSVQWERLFMLRLGSVFNLEFKTILYTTVFVEISPYNKKKFLLKFVCI